MSEEPRFKPIKLVFFAHNRDDAAVKKRAHSFMNIGVNVFGVMFRRDNAELEPGPNWDNLDLGLVPHCQHLKRVGVLIGALGKIISNRSSLVDVDILYARNLDMLLLALVSNFFLPKLKRPKIVYECLDVHAAMTSNGLSGRLLRWVERRTFNIIDQLVISSPAFMTEYFFPVQKYAGPYELLENKLYFGANKIPRPVSEELQNTLAKPITIAWVGILRCQKTLDLLKYLAGSEPDKIIIRFKGLISDFLIPDFNQQISGYHNISYEGPYSWPDGLVDAYSDVDFVWAQELSWSGHNSDWLLPNRIYEGSYFGALAISIEGTETSKVVRERNLGYVLIDEKGPTLVNFIRNLGQSEIVEKRKALLNSVESNFIATNDDVSKFIENILAI